VPRNLTLSWWRAKVDNMKLIVETDRLTEGQTDRQRATRRVPLTRSWCSVNVDRWDKVFWHEVTNCVRPRRSFTLPPTPPCVHTTLASTGEYDWTIPLADLGFLEGGEFGNPSERSKRALSGSGLTGEWNLSICELGRGDDSVISDL